MANLAFERCIYWPSSYHTNTRYLVLRTWYLVVNYQVPVSLTVDVRDAWSPSALRIIARVSEITIGKATA